MNKSDYLSYLKSEFIESLLIFTKNNISYLDAKKIADKKFSTLWNIEEWIKEDSVLGHKGPNWCAKQISRKMGY